MPDEQNLRVRSRVRLELPVRIRQIGPPRDSTEITRTMDVSRNGLLFRTRDAYHLHATVWVTLHYNPKTLPPEPEFPGSVVRTDHEEDGWTQVAVEFHSARADHPKSVYGTAATRVAPEERREKNRVRMLLPIRVRRDGELEESVTLDVSRGGVLFRSAQPYPVGENVWVVMPYHRGDRGDEVPARVVRIVETGGIRGVALEFLPSGRGLPFMWPDSTHQRPR